MSLTKSVTHGREENDPSSPFCWIKREVGQERVIFMRKKMDREKFDCRDTLSVAFSLDRLEVRLTIALDSLRRRTFDSGDA
ncbi:hypothetical protein [Gloeobacter kilaueensis]|uniref:hypothetical protein n=1 Tax=Gloeobacter kilaueensis TaxID=1416614 RepID=UPI0011823E47|nr:hypothetical protein [Gloeobacter kilaueensis]